MAKWSDNIAKILRESTIQKITGNLINEVDGVIGKCALGVISCEVGIPITPEMSMSDMLPSYQQILRKANVPEEYIKWGGGIPFRGFADITLDRVIWHLNDSERFSFKEIADFIETTFKGDDNGD